MISRLIIYGAGVAGKLFFEQISHDKNYNVVAFVDDSRETEGDFIGNIPVYSSASLEDLLVQQSVSKIIVTIPSITNKLRNDIISRLLKLGAEVAFLPSHQQIIEGSVKLDNSSFLKIIGRDGGANSAEYTSKAFNHLNVLVTGGGGSIGSEICRQLLSSKPRVLFVLDSSEFNLFKLSQTLSGNSDTKIKYILGDFGDEDLLSRILTDNHLDYLFHAGAYKHVALVEDNVFSTIKNNVIGSYVLFNTVLSHDNGSSVKIVNVSTDKAVNPTSVMGATKRVVELLSAYFCSKFGNKIVNVRFGNVFGSSGSVIPIFVDQINRGGAVTVTHPDVERYFMSIPEAVELVLSVSFLSATSNTYFLDMGDPVNILGLAQRLIRSFGFEPVVTDQLEISNNEIQILFTGLKPGEKLSEELTLTKDYKKTENPRIFLCDEATPSLKDVEDLYNYILKEYGKKSKHGIVSVLASELVGYQPQHHNDPC